VLAKAQEAHWQDGATAVAVWVAADTAMVANVGAGLLIRLLAVQQVL
jgi:hypothetical protein